MVRKKQVDNSDNKKPIEESGGDPVTSRLVTRTPRDILCGRGFRTHHPGNLRLHMLIDKFRPLYFNTRRKDKHKVIKLIINESEKDGARFLRPLEGTENQWEEVEDDIAYDKVSHALRVQNRTIHLKRLKATNNNKPPMESTNTTENENKLEKDAKSAVTGGGGGVSGGHAPSSLCGPSSTITVPAPTSKASVTSSLTPQSAFARHHQGPAMIPGAASLAAAVEGRLAVLRALSILNPGMHAHPPLPPPLHQLQFHNLATDYSSLQNAAIMNSLLSKTLESNTNSSNTTATKKPNAD